MSTIVPRLPVVMGKTIEAEFVKAPLTAFVKYDFVFGIWTLAYPAPEGSTNPLPVLEIDPRLKAR
jgi:hypothetical protein